jgi:hypothetical protein
MGETTRSLTVRGALGLLALALASCANSQTYLAKPPAEYRRVGIVSVVGSEFTFKHVGTTAFTNEAKTVLVPQWGLDRFIAETLGERLKSRYTIEPTEFPADRFRQLDSTSFGAFTILQSVGDAVREHVQPAGLDAYIVVIKADRGDEISNTNQALIGVGLLDRTVLSRRADALYTAFDIYIVDGRTYRVVSHAAGARYEKTILTQVAQMPFRIVDADLWRDSPDAMTPEQTARIKVILQELLKSGIDGALAVLALS